MQDLNNLKHALHGQNKNTIYPKNGLSYYAPSFMLSIVVMDSTNTPSLPSLEKCTFYNASHAKLACWAIVIA